MESKRTDAAWGFGLAAPVLVALGHTGFFFEMEFPIAAAALVAGALIAGVMLGQSIATRAAYVVAFIVMGAGITAATIWYTSASARFQRTACTRTRAASAARTETELLASPRQSASSYGFRIYEHAEIALHQALAERTYATLGRR